MQKLKNLRNIWANFWKPSNSEWRICDESDAKCWNYLSKTITYWPKSPFLLQNFERGWSKVSKTLYKFLSNNNLDNIAAIKTLEGTLLLLYYFTFSLEKIAPSERDDLILGHIMVLSQHRWPHWRDHSDLVLKTIEEKQTFTFELFSQYVISKFFVNLRNTCSLLQYCNVGIDYFEPFSS